jgi:steroid delta-isomerase-like uncharacterized protein
MATPENIHQLFKAAFNAKDWPAYKALLHPEYTFMGGDGQLKTGGPELGLGIAQMYGNAFPDAKLELLTLTTAPNMACVEMRATGTQTGELMGVPASGKAVDLRVVNIVELKDGLIYREREYIDMLTMMTQIGAIPAVAH